MSIDPANLSSEKVKLPDPARVEIYFTSTPSPNSTPSLFREVSVGQEAYPTGNIRRQRQANVRGTTF